MKLYKIKKIRQGFYKDEKGNIYVGYIKSSSNFHYMTCELISPVLCASDCFHLTPIRLKEGLRLWTEKRIKNLKKYYKLKKKK